MIFFCKCFYEMFKVFLQYLLLSWMGMFRPWQNFVNIRETLCVSTMLKSYALYTLYSYKSSTLLIWKNIVHSKLSRRWSKFTCFKTSCPFKILDSKINSARRQNVCLLKLNDSLFDDRMLDNIYMSSCAIKYNIFICFTKLASITHKITC